MKISRVTSQYNPNSLNRNNVYAAQTSFEGFRFPTSSQFLTPIKRGANKLFDGISKYYTKPLFESPVAVWLSKQDKVGQIVNHMQTLGSFIISGMYMLQTYRNNDMHEERKKTLMVNQGLTLAASTLGAYTIDGALAGLWDRKVALKYAKEFLNDETFPEKFAKYNEKLKAEFLADAANAGKKFKPAIVGQYVSKVVRNPALSYKLGGLDILKSLAVFGTVYRFLSPVAVTPIANWASDTFLHSAKKESKNAANAETTSFSSSVPIEKPEISKFISRN